MKFATFVVQLNHYEKRRVVQLSLHEKRPVVQLSPYEICIVCGATKPLMKNGMWYD